MSTSVSHDRASELAASLVKARLAHPTDTVTIAGRGQLELLLAFAHQGLRSVACRDAAVGPHAGEAATDLLLIPDIEDESELRSALMRLGPALRDGGMVVAVARHALSAVHVRHLHRLLTDRGFAVVQPIGGAGGPAFICARKGSMAAARAA